MYKHFEGLLSHEHFVAKASRNILLLYNYFLHNEYVGKSEEKIHVPVNPTLSGKTKNVLSHLNNYFGSNLWQKHDNPALDGEDIAARAITDPSLSPLPSVLFSGES